jgi:hypothetical protein
MHATTSPACHRAAWGITTADALGGRGMGYEHLDQLALEHLYGVR